MRKIIVLAFISISLFGADRFKVSGNTIKDFETELMWQKNSSSSTMNYSSAVKYCKKHSLGGYSDWRLPHIDELKSIVNYQAYSPATFKGFNLKTNDWHWSITKYNSSYSWVVYFNSGLDNWNDKTGNSYAVCVRDLL